MLEQALADNTAAVRELIALLKQGASLPTVTKTKAEPTKAEPTKAEPTKAEPTKAEPTKAEPTKAEPTKAEPTEAAALSYDEHVAPVLGELLKKGGKQALVTLLARFGATTGRGLKAEQYAAAIEDAKTLLAAQQQQQQTEALV